MVAPKPFDDKDFIFEIKWDGYRAIADLRDKDEPLFYSRNGINFLKKFKTIADDLQKQEFPMVIDGEVVAFNEKGKPDFQKLQQIEDNPDTKVVFEVFDLLWLNGYSTENLTLIERKELLKDALTETQTIQYCEHVEEKGKAFFEEIKNMDLEGLMAKRKDSVYRENHRTRDWLKVRYHQETEALICGFTEPKGSRDKFGAIILGQEMEGKLTYIGHTGTGFNNKTLHEIHQKMDSFVIKKSPFEKTPKTNAPATWVKPVLTAKIHYTERTKDGILRHPVYKGLVEKETKHTKNTNMKNDDYSSLKLSNLEKLFWKEEGITKGDLIEYYLSIAPYILPYLKDRPQTLVRFPNGISGLNFYQKDAPEGLPEWIKTVPIFSESNQKEINYIVCNDEAAMAYLINLGCIDFNPWNSRTQHLDKPDWLLIDLDPSEKNTFDDVIETALATKEICDKIKANAFLKTSGSSGLHIYLPLEAKYSYEQAKDFAHLLMQKINEKLPKITTLERSLSKRQRDKIYLDYLQNRRGQTLASVYSVRPKPGAPVSTPLKWKELKFGLYPKDFNIYNTLKRIKSKGDFFEPVLGKGIDMLKCLNFLKD